MENEAKTSRQNNKTNPVSPMLPARIIRLLMASLEKHPRVYRVKNSGKRENNSDKSRRNIMRRRIKTDEVKAKQTRPLRY